MSDFCLTHNIIKYVKAIVDEADLPKIQIYFFLMPQAGQISSQFFIVDVIRINPQMEQS